MRQGEQRAMFDSCFEYDDNLRANGRFAGGQALQPAADPNELMMASEQQRRQTTARLRRPRGPGKVFRPVGRRVILGRNASGLFA